MTPEEQRACIEPLMLAGRIIIESGGETYRVEETVTRMGTAFGLKDVEAFAIPSGLFISYMLPDENTVSALKRAHPGATDLTKVDLVNRVSRRVEHEKLSPAEALSELKKIHRTTVNPKLLSLGSAVCASGFTLMFLGGLVEMAVAFVVAFLVQMLGILLEKHKLQTLIYTLLGSMLTALIPELVRLAIPTLNTVPIIAGALMPLLPGLMMTTAIQDTLKGDMVSGLSRIGQAILTACLVAGGVILAAFLFSALPGGAR